MLTFLLSSFSKFCVLQVEMAPCRPGDVDGLVQALCESPPTSTEETLRRVSMWAEDVVRRALVEEGVRWWEEVPPPEEKPSPKEDREEAGAHLPIYCVTRGPATKRAELGIWTGTWDQLRDRLGFTRLFGSGFHVKRCDDIEAARAYWSAEGRKGNPAERRLDASSS